LLLANFFASICLISVHATSATTITIAVSNTNASGDPQRNLFAVNESGTIYTFAFYANSSGGYYCTSTDNGATWTNPTLAFAGILNEAFSLRYRNYNSTDYVYLAYSTDSPAVGAYINFSRGSISGSTITWGSQYVVQAADSSQKMGNPDVECATDGTVFVSFSYGESASPYALQCRVNWNANNDGLGSWSGTYFDYKTGIGNTNNLWTALTRLSDTNGTGKVYCAYAGDDLSALKGTLWNGSTWGTVETVTTDSLGAQFFSLGSYGNSTYIMFVNSTMNYNPVFNTRSLNNPFWGTESKASSDAAGAVSMCINQANGDVWGVWGNTIDTAINYAQYNGTWQAAQTLYNASAGYSINPPSVMTYYDVMNNAVGTMWYESHLTDYHLRYLSLSVVPTADVTPPTYSNVAYNSTTAGNSCLLTCLWTDNVNVSGFIVGNNNTGTWQNTTWTSTWSNWADSESAWANITLTLNSSYNFVVQFEWWCNDTSGNWNNTGILSSVTSATLIDSCQGTPGAWETLLFALHPSNDTPISDEGQSFTTLPSKYNITSVVFTGHKVGNPTGIACAVLYAHNGVYGNSSVPTGPPLATSNGFDMSTLLTTDQNITFTFNSSQQYTLQPNTHYCIDLQNPSSGTLNSSNCGCWRFNTGDINPNPTHSGNEFYYQNGSWNAFPTEDFGFYVYGVANQASAREPGLTPISLVLIIATVVVGVVVVFNVLGALRKKRLNSEPCESTKTDKKE